MQLTPRGISGSPRPSYRRPLTHCSKRHLPHLPLSKAKRLTAGGPRPAGSAPLTTPSAEARGLPESPAHARDHAAQKGQHPQKQELASSPPLLSQLSLSSLLSVRQGLLRRQQGGRGVKAEPRPPLTRTP